MKNFKTRQMNLKLSFFLLFITIAQLGFAQNKDYLTAINEQVWHDFTLAFEKLDHQLLRAVHSTEMVRIEGDRQSIQELDPYMEGYASWFQQVKQAGNTLQIRLRFLERINTDHTASERGIYQLTIKDAQDTDQIYYGKFHVVLKKENDVWKIVMDYDSSEGNTIGEEDFKAANNIVELNHFIQATGYEQ